MISVCPRFLAYCLMPFRVLHICTSSYLVGRLDAVRSSEPLCGTQIICNGFKLHTGSFFLQIGWLLKAIKFYLVVSRVLGAEKCIHEFQILFFLKPCIVLCFLLIHFFVWTSQNTPLINCINPKRNPDKTWRNVKMLQGRYVCKRRHSFSLSLTHPLHAWLISLCWLL